MESTISIFFRELKEELESEDPPDPNTSALYQRILENSGYRMEERS